MLRLDTGNRAAEQPAGRLLSASVVATVLLAALLAWSPAGADAGKRAKRSVACFKTTAPGPGVKPAFEKKPKNCVYIAKGALDLVIPPVTAVQSTRGIRWKRWGGRRATGRGGAYVAGRAQPLPVQVTLSKPVKRCGHKVYTRAKFNFKQYGFSTGPFNLSTC